MKLSTSSVLFVALVLALLTGLSWRLSAADRTVPAAAGHRYTVVTTDGSHLVVTDNQTSTVYFYAIGDDEKVGAALTLRGTLDLTAVGKPTLTPTLLKKK